MIKILKGFPDDLVAMECIGTVTAEDYRDVLIPEVTQRLKDHKALRVLCIVDERFEGYTPGAAWSDFTFGIAHWNQFSRLAVVTDVGWIRSAMAFFTPLFHSMKAFHVAELDDAKRWILEQDKT